MAKYETEGYCPNNDVYHFSYSEECENLLRRNLAGLWSIIGSSVVCIAESKDQSVNTDAVYKMFTTDPVAEVLMTEIIKYNANADKIAVRQIHGGACNTQYFSDIQKTLAETKNPKLVLRSGSEFAVIISEADYGIDVHFWYLPCCW